MSMPPSPLHLGLQNHIHILDWSQPSIDNIVTVDDLKTYLGHEPKPFELFNWIEKRDLMSPITDEDRQNHDWLTDVRKYLNISQNAPVLLEDLQKRLTDATWQQHLNCLRGKPLRTRIPYTALVEYLKNIPSLDQQMNWYNGRELSYENRPDEMDAHPWKKHLKAIYNIEERDPQLKDHEVEEKSHTVSLKKRFEKVIKNGTWQQLINCEREKPLNQEISLQEFREYHKSLFNGALPTLDDEMNWLMNRPMDYKIRPEDRDTHHWKKHVTLHFNLSPHTYISRADFEDVRKQTVTDLELVNCNLEYALSSTCINSE